MTLFDLIESGVVIQGAVTIKQWLKDAEVYKTLYSTTSFQNYNVDDKIMNMQINYIYSESEYNVGWTIIEMEPIEDE